MARWEFKLPDIGEGVTEGEIVGWMVKVGDRVLEDQPVIDVMTDKATVTITSPKAGTVIETFGKIGDVVPIHSTLVIYELDGSAAETAEPSSNKTQDEAPSLSKAENEPAAQAPAVAPQASSGHVSSYFNEQPLATPATRKLARELQVDLQVVPPSGPHDRVLKRDVERFAAQREQGAAPQSAAPQSAPARAQVSIAQVTSARSAGALEQRQPFAGMRRKIAQKMAQSKQTAAHFTFVEECDVSALKALRQRMLPLAAAQGVKLTYLPFIAKAVCAALKKHPILNAALDEVSNELVFRDVVHLGIAASTDAGLMVPVVRDADSKSLLQIARDIARLGEEAKSGKAKAEELSGSTFTISSLGAQGGLFATPILNFPEVGILGVHQIKQKPVVRDGQIVIGEVMLLSLSFDHRIVDGHVGAAFAYDIIGYLEQPDRLLLEG